MNTLLHPAFELGHPFAWISHRLTRRPGSRPVPAPHPATSSVSLAAQGIHAVRSFRGSSVECTQGCVWLTYDGDCRDVVLQAGQSHVGDRDTRLVISAMEPSAVRLAPPIARRH